MWVLACVCTGMSEHGPFADGTRSLLSDLQRESWKNVVNLFTTIYMLELLPEQQGTCACLSAAVCPPYGRVVPRSEPQCPEHTPPVTGVWPRVPVALKRYRRRRFQPEA